MTAKKRFAATAVAAVALAGAAASTAQAAVGASPDQVISLYNRTVGGMLDVYCSGPGGPVAWPTVPGDACQRWRIVDGTEGYLLESVVYPGLCVQAPESIGQVAGMTACDTSDPSQQWDFPRIGNEVFIAQAGDNSQVLGVTFRRGPIELEQMTGAVNQRWYVAPPA
jgi:hypothetical protein